MDFKNYEMPAFTDLYIGLVSFSTNYYFRLSSLNHNSFV